MIIDTFLMMKIERHVDMQVPVTFFWANSVKKINIPVFGYLYFIKVN